MRVNGGTNYEPPGPPWTPLGSPASNKIKYCILNQVWEGNPGWWPNNQRRWPCSQSRGQVPSQVDRSRIGTVQIKGNTRVSFKVWLKWENLCHYFLLKCLNSLYFRIFINILLFFYILYYYILNYIIYLVISYNYVGCLINSVSLSNAFFLFILLMVILIFVEQGCILYITPSP